MSIVNGNKQLWSGHVEQDRFSGNSPGTKSSSLGRVEEELTQLLFGKTKAILNSGVVNFYQADFNILSQWFWNTVVDTWTLNIC